MSQTRMPTPGAALARAFDSAASHYDRLVGLSPGYHRQLSGSARAFVARLPGDARQVLDLGCGTGASTAALVSALGAAGRADVEVCGVDASAGMIAQAQAKSWPGTVRFSCADAVADLAARPEASVGGIFAAYLVRNLEDPDAFLAQVARVLIPGGALLVHDYSVAGNRRATLVWQLVCRAAIIPSAYLADRDVSLYRYLYRSVLDFDSIPRLRQRLVAAGLRDVEHATVWGWEHGIVHRISGHADAGAPSRNDHG